MSYFQPDDELLALSTSQGIERGNLYRVLDIDKQATPFGVFVSYQMQRVDLMHEDTPLFGDKLWVRNAHLLMERPI